MAMVEIPRRTGVIDPTWPNVDWPYRTYAWKRPHYRRNGVRIPDYLPLIEPPAPREKLLWLPAYNELPDMEALTPFPYRNYVWYMEGSETELPTSGYPIIPAHYDTELQLTRRFDQDFVFHPRGKYYLLSLWIPGYDAYSDYLFVKERLNFNLWGPKDFSHLTKPYQVVFDSRIQHPNTHFCYSAVRVDPHLTVRQRKKFYCNNWKKNVVPMAYMVERATKQKHHIVIVEQAPLAHLMFRRIMYGYNLTGVCICTCFFTILASNYRNRWPCVFLFPCLVGAYCRHVYNWEFRQDPAKKYGFWTTWVNDPLEHEVFKHIDVYPDLLRQERMTFMQLEDLEYRQRLNGFFTSVSVIVALRTLFYRIKYKDVGETIAWEALKTHICTHVTSTLRYAHDLMHPFNAHCSFDDEMVGPTRFLFWAGVLSMYIFFAPPLIIRIKKRFDRRTRTRLIINQVSIRAMKGERRYIRLLQPFYWLYRWAYPRDDMGARDKWYLTQRFRNTPGSHQFYY